VGAAVALAAVTLLAGWIIWQPLRSSDASGSAVSALVAGNAGAALTDARTAAAADPVDIAPHQLLSSIYLALGNPVAARAELVKATTLQPSNPDSWSALATFDTNHHNNAAVARDLARVAALTRG
jgi:predicted Zn-dependent protease